MNKEPRYFQKDIHNIADVAEAVAGIEWTLMPERESIEAWLAELKYCGKLSPAIFTVSVYRNINGPYRVGYTSICGINASTKHCNLDTVKRRLLVFVALANKLEEKCHERNALSAQMRVLREQQNTLHGDVYGEIIAHIGEL